MSRYRLIAVGLFSAAASMTAYAQAATTTAPAEEPKKDEKVVVLEEYKVTSSFRGSLAAAAEKKEASQGIVEVIASEDIGKLPDVSIADSLTRLTGLAAQRTNGRAQQISIRGLNGDFSTGTLNGREQVSTNENRAVEFDQYPAELLSGVVVYKTAAANLTGQGIAGTVDMQTVQPLSKSGRTIAANAYYQWTQLSQLTPGAKAKGERFAISYVDQNADKTVGYAFGYAHSNNPYEGQQFQAWGYPTDSGGNFALGGTKSYVRTSNLKRDGFMGVIEFKPNENIHSTIDVYSSKFEEKQLLRGLEIPLAFWSGAQLQAGYTTSGGLMTNATLTNVQPVVRNDVFKRTDSPFAIGWNLKMGEKSEWPVTFDAGYSRITRTDENLETWAGWGFRGGVSGSQTADTMTVKLAPGQIPVITATKDYSTGTGLALTDPQGWGPTSLPGGGMMGYLKFFQAKDELGQIKAFTNHELKGFFHDVEVGLSYTDRYKKDGENPSGFINSSTNSQRQALPAQIGTTDMSFLGLGRVYAYDPLAAYAAGVWGFTPNLSTDMAVNTFQVEEKLTQFYTQLNIDTKAGQTPVKGNIGVRVVNTNQNSKGLSASGGLLNPASGGAKYTNVAPSLNLSFTVADQTYLRFSASREIMRPRMYDMRASQSWSYNATLANSTDLAHSPWSGGGGNTKLKPWQADALDLSFEKYFAEGKGYVSLAAFHKKLVSYIYTQTVLQDFTGYPIRNGGTPQLWQGPASQPANGSGGNIRGLEASVTLASELFNKDIKGFGLQFGGAYTDSSIQPWGPGNGNAAIAGLSRKVANITLYYERHGFQARISERYRSANRQYITTFGPPNRAGDNSSGSGFTTALAEKIVDAQISYAFQSGPLKNLEFLLQAYNLNNEPLVTYNNGDARQVMNYQKYGASYSFGASYKF